LDIQYAAAWFRGVLFCKFFSFKKENLQKPFSNPAKYDIILLYFGNSCDTYASYCHALIHNDLKGNDKNE